MANSLRSTTDDLNLIGEDISRIMLLITAQNTPFLDRLTMGEPATNLEHKWRERELNPDRVVVSTAVNSATADTGVTISGGFGVNLQTGMLVELESSGGGAPEIARIKSIAGANSLLLQRNINGNVNSLAVGDKLFVIGTNNLEGADTSGDVSRTRNRRSNFTQIFQKPLGMTGSERAVQLVPDLGDEFEEQAVLRAIELSKDFEKTLIRGYSANTIGDTVSVYRSMGGLRHFCTDIASTVAANSFTADPLLWLNDQLQEIYSRGGRDIDLILCGDQWKRDISGTNAAKFQVAQDDTSIRRLVDYIQTDFGSVEVLMSPWMPRKAFACVSTQRIIPVNLRGRAFQREDLGKTGDSSKAQVIGEYTAEFHHPDKMSFTRVV